MSDFSWSFISSNRLFIVFTLSDMRLNLKMIGSYIALQQPMQIQERMSEVTEYMEQQLDHLDQHYSHGV